MFPLQVPMKSLLGTIHMLLSWIAALLLDSRRRDIYLKIFHIKVDGSKIWKWTIFVRAKVDGLGQNKTVISINSWTIVNGLFSDYGWQIVKVDGDSYMINWPFVPYQLNCSLSSKKISKVEMVVQFSSFLNRPLKSKLKTVYLNRVDWSSPTHFQNSPTLIVDRKYTDP